MFGLPVPFLTMWAPSWEWVIAANALRGIKVRPNRGNHDWTNKYQNVVEACRKLSCRLRILAMLSYSVAMSP